jgi:hypothetical protein
VTFAHPEALSPRAQLLGAALGARPWSKDFYLAGSAALALYAGHRPVAELDLMSPTNRLQSADRRDLLADLVAMDPGAEVETARDGYLFMRFPGGAALRLFHYPYPHVEPSPLWQGLAVASAIDLGLMKIGAIISRGTRRDFVDLYVLCRDVPLALLLERAGEKFGRVRDFPLQALKGLADVSEVADEPMPHLALPVRWEDVEAWRTAAVGDLARHRLDLATDPGAMEDPASSLPAS